MGLLKGSIYCKMSDAVIPDGSVLKILMFDASERVSNKPGLSQSPACLIGKTEIKYPKAFPIEYSLNYRERHTDLTNNVFYFLTVLIEKGSNVLFNNDDTKSEESVSMPFLEDEYGDLMAINTKVRRHLDVYLHPVFDEILDLLKP